MVTNVLRKPILSGLLESDIGTVRDMSEIAMENKVYSFKYVVIHENSSDNVHLIILYKVYNYKYCLA